MSKEVCVRDLLLGTGRPKICVPLTGESKEQLLAQARDAVTAGTDMVEWRVDYFAQSDRMDAVKDTLKELREELGKVPLLFTYRTKGEGGRKEISSSDYLQLYFEVLATRDMDLIDVELSAGEEVIADVVDAAHRSSVLIIVSSHDFCKTPPMMEMYHRLVRMREVGADIPKIAVMPQKPADVLALLGATAKLADGGADYPIISMSMGWEGSISRVAGEFFGSCLTFGTVGQASAPGQLSVKDLHKVMDILAKPG